VVRHRSSIISPATVRGTEVSSINGKSLVRSVASYTITARMQEFPRQKSMEKAFRYRFYPTPSQSNLLRRTIGCTRLVYNKALALRTEAFYDSKQPIGYSETSQALTALSADGSRQVKFARVAVTNGANWILK
jgi:Helix-turn-helix domain